jgi:hypothetical protein
MKQALKTTLAILASTVFWSFSSQGFAQEAPKPMRGADVAAVPTRRRRPKNTWAASRAGRKKWRVPSTVSHR